MWEEDLPGVVQRTTDAGFRATTPTIRIRAEPMNHRKHPPALLSLLLTFLLSGCGSFITWADGFEEKLPENHNLVRVYSGVLWDLNVMDPSTAIGQPPDEDPEQPYFNVLYVFDLPFSFLADTLALPWSIYDQTVYGSYRRRGPVK